MRRKRCVLWLCCLTLLLPDDVARNIEPIHFPLALPYGQGSNIRLDFGRMVFLQVDFF